MSSPRFRPAGLELSWGRHRVFFDGGPGAEPDQRPDAWLITDLKAELIRDIRGIAHRIGVEPSVASFVVRRGRGWLRVTPLPVVHTSRPTWGYLVESGAGRVVWAPEFWKFPEWAAGAGLMFADAAGWARPIRFARGVGGHAPVLETAAFAQRVGIQRLVFAHIGRPSIRAMDAGLCLPFGEWGVEGGTYRVRPRPVGRASVQ